MSSELEPSSSGPGSSPDDPEELKEIPEPMGTLFLLTIYVIVLAGMWGTMYWILITR